MIGIRDQNISLSLHFGCFCHFRLPNQPTDRPNTNNHDPLRQEYEMKTRKNDSDGRSSSSSSFNRAKYDTFFLLLFMTIFRSNCVSNLKKKFSMHAFIRM